MESHGSFMALSDYLPNSLENLFALLYIAMLSFFFHADRLFLFTTAKNPLAT